MTEIIEDLVIPNKAKQQVSNTDNIKLIDKSVETSSTKNIIKCESPIKNNPQEVITSNDQMIIDEKPHKPIEKIDDKVVSETSYKVSSTKPFTNISSLVTAKIIEPMDVESNSNLKLTNESLNNIEDEEEEEDNEKFIGMLNDFIDSD